MRRFGRFWIDFIIGDDWRIAAGVVLAVAATAALAHSGVEAWWLLPLAAATILTVAVWR
jgi:hypothetical protein